MSKYAPHQVPPSGGKSSQTLSIRILCDHLSIPFQLLHKTVSILENTVERDDGSPFCHLSLPVQKDRITHLWPFLLAVVPPLRSLTKINAATAEDSPEAAILYNIQGCYCVVEHRFYKVLSAGWCIFCYNIHPHFPLCCCFYLFCASSAW